MDSRGPLGFVLPLLVIWPLTAVWDDIPGPVEPFTIVAGGLIGTPVFQWLALRRKGMESKRWLILWCVGLPRGMVHSPRTTGSTVIPGEVLRGRIGP